MMTKFTVLGNITSIVMACSIMLTTSIAAQPAKTAEVSKQPALITLICIGKAPRYTRGWEIEDRIYAMDRASRDTQIVVEIDQNKNIMTTSIPFLIDTPVMQLHVVDKAYSGSAPFEKEWTKIKAVSLVINRQSGAATGLYTVGDEYFTAFDGFCTPGQKL